MGAIEKASKTPPVVTGTGEIWRQGRGVQREAPGPGGVAVLGHVLGGHEAVALVVSPGWAWQGTGTSRRWPEDTSCLPSP